MKKIYSFLLLGLLLSIGNAWAETATFDYDTNAGVPFGITGTSSGSDNHDGDITENVQATIDGITITLSPKTSGNNNNRFWATSPKLRMYNGTMVVDAGTKTITNIAFNVGSNKCNLTPSSGNVTGSGTAFTWTGTANSITFTIGSNSQFKSMVITYTAGAVTPTCEAPSFSPAAGTYSSAQNVTLSSETEGATIYYTTDGTDPTTESSVYSTAIPVAQTTTIKAFAAKANHNNSAIVTAVYTIQIPTTISVAREAEIGDNVFTQGIVTSSSTDGKTVYIQDANAAIVVYGTSNLGLAVGDEITVSGTLDSYNGLLEIKNVTVQTLSTGNVVTPEVMTIAQANASSKQGWLIEIVGAKVTGINGKTVTIAQETNDIAVRFNGDVNVSQNDIVTLVGNIGCYNGIQIANPSNIRKGTTVTLGTNGWSTFSATYKYVVSGAEVYMAAPDAGQNATKVVLTKVENGIVPAEEGVILKGTEGATVTIAPTNEAASDFDEEANMLMGTATQEGSASTGSNVYVLATFNNVTAFYPCNTTIPMNKAFMYIYPAATQAPIRIEFAENNATNIESLKANENVQKFFENGQVRILREGVVYDATGRVVR